LATLGGPGLAGDRDRLGRVVEEQLLAGGAELADTAAAALGQMTRRSPATIGVRISLGIAI
jgi:hypothetical protein